MVEKFEESLCHEQRGRITLETSHEKNILKLKWLTIKIESTIKVKATEVGMAITNPQSNSKCNS